MTNRIHIKAETPEGAVMRLLDVCGPTDIATAVDLFIARLDTLSAADDEPDFQSRSDGLPGDPGDAEPDDDAQGDPSWPEWQSRGRHKLARAGSADHEPIKRADGHGIALEDDEDDDPAEEDDDDGCSSGDDNLTNWGAHGIFAHRYADGTLAGELSDNNEDSEADGDERDGNCSEDDFMVHDDNGPGCPIADPGEENGDKERGDEGS